jgi:antirestriction protein ArdC
VFTFNAWKALGRSVKRGQHGVKVVTWIDCTATTRDPQTGEEKTEGYRRPHTTTVFHISQTEPTSEREARFASTARRGHRNADRDPGYVDPGELAEDRWNEHQSRYWR